MYTKIESRFWQDEKMRAVSDDARYLMLYLLTSPHRNILGLYFLPSPYACFDLGWDEKRFQKGLQELLQTGCIKYDTHAHIVLVQNYLKYNPLENPNQVKSAIEKLKEIPQTPLLQDLLTIVKQLNKPFMKPLLERLQERLPKPGTGTGSGTGTEDNNIVLTDDCPPDGERGDAEENHGSSQSESVKPDKTPYAEIVRLYNEICVSLPKVQVISDSRKRAMRVLWKRHPDLETFRRIFEAAEQSDFLSGRSGKWNGCNFDWLLKERNATKVLEGVYANKESPQAQKDIPKEWRGLKAWAEKEGLIPP